MKERYLLINDIVAFGARLEKHIGSDEFLRYPRKTQRMTYLLYSQVRAALEESSVQRAEESFLSLIHI